MSNCNVTFYKDTDDKKGTGHYKNYDGPQSVSDLNQVQWHGQSHDDMKDDISWIDTSSEAWVHIYSKANFQGRRALVGPNQHVNLKILQDENNEGDMNDTVESFQIFDHKPDVDTSNIIKNFIALYPGSERGRKDNLYESEWYAQDSKYRVYDPSILLANDTVSFVMNLDHIQLESDDHAEVTFSMSLHGDFVDRIHVTYDMASATQIPDWAIKLIDGTIEATKYAAIAIADGAEIVLTDGIGVVAVVETNKLIEYTAKALTFCVDHMNIVLGAVFKFQSDGGATNFPAIVSHSIARLVLAYYRELYGPDSNTPLRFVDGSFLSAFGANSWDNSKHNPCVTFEQGNYSFRSYYPDNTFFYARGGALSTVKIDAITDYQKDDHLVLQVVFDPQGRLFSVVGCIDIFMVKDVTDYTAPASGVLTYNADRQIIHLTQGREEVTVLSGYQSLESAYAYMMKKALNDTAAEYGISITGQQITLVDASVKVLAAINAAIQ